MSTQACETYTYRASKVRLLNRVWDWDDELNHYVDEITEPVDCIILDSSIQLQLVTG